VCIADDTLGDADRPIFAGALAWLRRVTIVPPAVADAVVLLRLPSEASPASGVD
jgi:hypothetical protein